jgi:hypothetical protein
VKFDDLDVEEQHRREEAGRLLHDLNRSAESDPSA